MRISEQNARAQVESARGDALSVKARAEAEAESVRKVGLARAEAESESVRRVGAARAEAESERVLKVGAAQAEAHRQGQEALGPAAYTAVQVATILGEHHVKLVPDIAVGGAGGGGMTEALLGRMLAASLHGAPAALPAAEPKA